MSEFTKITGVVAPILWNNVDTDMISPKQVLKTVSKAGLAWGFFQEYRFKLNGDLNPEFILNQKPWDKASIIVSLENWGCGSSREHAVWAMRDYGIRCVIAASFAEIHYTNCFKNGILPISLNNIELEQVIKIAQDGLEITVDLIRCCIDLPNGEQINFVVDESRRTSLLHGMDEIDETNTQVKKIIEFESKYKKQVPWLFACKAT
jgi:3-isopropylmalate/(R)-2-methylmalate dehydratase small subunit